MSPVRTSPREGGTGTRREGPGRPRRPPRHRRLRPIEDAFDAVFEHLGIGVVLFDLNGRVVRCNRAYCELLGYEESELAGRTLLSLTHPGDRRRNRVLLEQLMAPDGRRQYVFEQRYLHQDGRPVPVQANASLLRAADGAPRYLLGMAVDISQKREADLARLESAEKSRLLASMSHEIRTPLNSILGFAELLQMQAGTSVSDKHRVYLDHIRSSVQHLLALINDFLDISKVEAGMMTALLEPVNVRTLVFECVGEMHSLAAKKGVELNVDGVPSISVETDERRLKQVLLNLLSNAIKFTEEGSVTVGAAARPDRLGLWVRDTGVGIAEEDQQMVFGEFAQVTGGRGPGHEQGTGLGLSLSRRLMEVLGGTIELASARGTGSTFTIVLPIPGEGVLPGAAPSQDAPNAPARAGVPTSD